MINFEMVHLIRLKKLIFPKRMTSLSTFRAQSFIHLIKLIVTNCIKSTPNKLCREIESIFFKFSANFKYKILYSLSQDINCVR